MNVFKEKLWDEKRIAIFFSFGLFLFLQILFFSSESNFDVGDGIKHFLISKYSWKHHDLFLSSWGKPFFTLVSSLFSQFGLKGIIFFNTFCGVLTGYFSYLILKHSGIKRSWPVIIFVIFTPGYFPTLNSGLTEPLFGLMLILSIYLLLLNNVVIAAVVISFLPYVRAEGYLIILVFATFYLLFRNFKSIAFLGLGTLLYAIIGYFVFNDFLWIIHQNPYKGSAKDIYGSGKLFHFFYKYKEITGTFILVFTAFTAILLIMPGTLNNISKTSPNIEKLKKLIFLLSMCFLVYFIAHVFMWWKGWANSLGLIRPIGAVLPCISIIAYIGFYYFTQLIGQRLQFVSSLILIPGVFCIAGEVFYQKYFPFKYNLEQKVINDAYTWLKEKKYSNNQIYIGYPYMAYLLNIDVFDNTRIIDLYSLKSNIKNWGVNSIKNGTIIIWDSHFGPESRLSLPEINSMPNFQLLGSFNSLVYDKNSHDNYFELHIYKKENDANHRQGTSQVKIDLRDKKIKNSHLIDFENIIENEPVVKYNFKDEYGPVINLNNEQIPTSTKKILFHTSLLNLLNDSSEATLVMTVYDRAKQVIAWEGKAFKMIPKNGSEVFSPKQFEFLMNPIWLSSKGTYLEFYVWNNKQKSFYQKAIMLQFLTN